MNRRARQTFSERQVQQEIARQFPGCPPMNAGVVNSWVRQRRWAMEVSLEVAVSTGVHTHIRHRLTQYDDLFGEPRLRRAEARFLIHDGVKEIIEEWQGTANKDLTA